MTESTEFSKSVFSNVQPPIATRSARFECLACAAELRKAWSKGRRVSSPLTPCCPSRLVACILKTMRWGIQSGQVDTTQVEPIGRWRSDRARGLVVDYKKRGESVIHRLCRVVVTAPVTRALRLRPPVMPHDVEGCFR